MRYQLIAKTVLLNVFLTLVLVSFLLSNGFAISNTTFTIFLFSITLLTSMYIGYKSNRFPELHGVVAGLISIAVLLLFVSAEVNMNWLANAIFTGVWVVTGFMGGMIGGALKRTTRGEKRSKQADR